MKKKSLWISTFLLLGVIVGGSYALRPQCTMIADEALGHFSIPIDKRTDRDFHLKVFQKKDDGHWYQCKTALTRQLHADF